MDSIELERDRQMEELSRLFADGAIDMAEYETRIDRVSNATSPEQIAAVTSDLRSGDNPGDWSPTPNVSPEQTEFTILGSRRLRGAWLRRRTANTITLLGETTIDLSDSDLDHDTTINVVTVLGECKIIVPADAEVRTSITPVLAEVSDRSGSRPDARQTIRLTGIALMAEVSIRRSHNA